MCIISLYLKSGQGRMSNIEDIIIDRIYELVKKSKIAGKKGN